MIFSITAEPTINLRFMINRELFFQCLILQFKYIIANQYACIEYAVQLIYQIFQYSVEAERRAM